ncbi:hypothetical protein SNOUR_21865 [Streptomyces noursei ATCC 11455]|uniref:DUF6344 domain-containing protein n=1 Tax=Streptomyces noursei TaxID=1971 RepID=UPI00081D2BF0|nr:hypothetical protein SNOUR_21865 [Streptomyces noursei ATCC 11455]
MAATKVMKFWAACLAVLGRLLASLGVSPAASAARRDAALYERTLGSAAPGTDGPEALDGAEPGHDPGPLPPAVQAARPFVPAARPAPRYGQEGSVRCRIPLPMLPPTLKQRIRAEAHGASPTSRVGRITGSRALRATSYGAEAYFATAPLSAAIPAARRREHTTARAA